MVANPFKQAVMLSYDIPSGVKWGLDHRKVLRKIGLRINLSDWILPAERIPTKLIEQMENRGANVHVLRFDETDAPKVKRLAIERLQQQIKDLRDRLGESLDEAASKLKQAEKEQSADLSEKAVLYARAALKRTERYIAEATEAATAFDILGEVDELFKAVSKKVVGGLKLWVLDELLKEEKKEKVKA